MTKTSSKIISIIFGVIAIYFTVNLIPDKTKKKFTALDKEFSFTKEIRITEKFQTDFESVYRVWINFENVNDSLHSIKKSLQILQDGKSVELYGNKNNLFGTESEGNYELILELKTIKDNSNLNKFNIKISEDGLPGPIYELMFEREYKWVYWTIDGFVILIALIIGYFGFRKKLAGNTTYN